MEMVKKGRINREYYVAVAISGLVLFYEGRGQLIAHETEGRERCPRPEKTKPSQVSLLKHHFLFFIYIHCLTLGHNKEIIYKFYFK